MFLDYLNSKHQNINFTMETESNNQISFLDVLVRKDDFNFNTTVFRKPTFSGLGVSYFSYCCRKFKLNSIKSLVSRAYGLCSTFHNLNNEFNYIKKYFINTQLYKEIHPFHSNIREHAQTCGTPITIDNFTILDSRSNTNDLRILESLYIFKDRPVLNNMQSSHPLCVVSK